MPPPLWRAPLLLLLSLLMACGAVPADEAFAVVALGATRAASLGRLLDSLAAARAQSPSVVADVMVMVDATHAPPAVHASVMEVAAARRVNVTAVRVPTPKSRSAHLAAVYKAMLDMAFVERRYPFAVFLEDDLLVAPDFFDFFDLARGALRSDPTLFCASAWHDRGHLATSFDETRVMRGEHFMGLGWMVSRATYLRLLLRMWPPDAFFDVNPHHPAVGQEWDDYFRKVLWYVAEERTAPLECIFPEVPRTHHTLDESAVGGGYSTSRETQRVHFDDMRLAVGAAPREALARSFARLVPLTLHDGRLMRAIEAAIPVERIAHALFFRNATLLYVCAACPLSANASDPSDAWHELLDGRVGVVAIGYDGIVRGIHLGCVSLRLHGNLVHVVSARSPLLRGAALRDTPREESAPPLAPCGSALSGAVASPPPPPSAFEGVAGERLVLVRAGQATSCSDACAQRHLICDDARMLVPAAALCPPQFAAFIDMPALCSSCCFATDAPALLIRGGTCRAPRASVASCRGALRLDDGTAAACVCQPRLQ